MVVESKQLQNKSMPDSLRDRDYSSYRQAEFERDSLLAVTGDDGKPVGSVLIAAIENMANEVRLLRLALAMRGMAEDIC